ncbi:MAG TPA: dihydropteroate synthase [Bryobacteraceae bacterium]|jgi:5-methyltetrahydrofolate--homocysteine methyltransferase
MIGSDLPFAAIGERINPTGRKQLGAQMAAGDYSAVARDARAQAAAGAALLDINAGYSMGNEPAMLREAVRAAQAACDLPLCLDSSSPEALAAALEIYEGKGLVNSVTGEERQLEAVLPLVRKHGCAVIGLVSDERGISPDPAERLAVARKIVERARDYGIPAEDVIIDPICLAVATEPRSVPVTLETLRLIRDSLGVNTCCGASNVSFGLPDRAALHAAFLPMAVSCGLTSAITDVTNPQISEAILATDFLLDRDQYARRWLARYREKARPV